MKNNIVFVGIGVALVVVFFATVAWQAKPATRGSLWNIASSTDEAQKAYEYKPDPDSSLIRFTPGIEQWYTNESLKFSFRLPEGFAAPDGKVKGQETYVVELSNNKGSSLYIVASRIKEGSSTSLSEDIIRVQSPGESLSQFSKVSLREGTGGLLFSTNSSSWNGSGISFWFIKDGYLYTLTTSAKDAELLDLVMQTFRFSPPIPPPPP